MITPFTRPRRVARVQASRWLPALGLVGTALLAAGIGLAAKQPDAPLAKTYAFDAQGRPVRLTAADGSAAEYRYDASGQLDEVRYQPAGAWLPGAGESVQVTSDAAAGALAITSRAGTRRYAVDPAGRHVDVDAPTGERLSYDFDSWGQRVRLAAGPRAVSYRYDILGHLLTAQDESGARVEYTYQPEQNRVERRLPSGVTSTFQAAADGNLVSIRHTAADGTLLCGYRYEYDADDRLSLVEESSAGGARITRYGYDDAGRLIAAESADGPALRFDYDALGNRTVQHRGPDRIAYEYADGRLLQAGESRFSYDAAGRLVARTDADGGTTTYQWDAQQRLVEVRTPRHTVRYTYDGLGQRLTRELDGALTRYETDTLAPVPQVIAEHDAAGRADYLLAPGRLGRRDASGRVTWLLEDRLGSARCVVDARGALLARYDYAPFGTPTLAEGTEQSAFLFAGEQWDAEAGLYYLRNRYYDPALGRFISEDPLPLAASLAQPQGLNRYAYAEGDPVNHVDPLGLQSEPPDWWLRGKQNSDWLNSHLLLPTPRPRFEQLGLSPMPFGIQTYLNPWNGALQQASYIRVGSPANLGKESFANPSTKELQKIGEFMVEASHALVAAGESQHVSVPKMLGWPSIVLNGSEAFHNVHDGQYFEGAKHFGELALAAGIPAYAAKLHPAVALVVLLNAVPSEVYIAGAFKLAHWQTEGFLNHENNPLTLASRFEPLAQAINVVTQVNSKVFDAVSAASSRLLPNSRQQSDALDAVAAIDPLIAGTLNRTRNLFFPPPPGGGGGAVPAVGGVYLDQIAQVFGELGSITAVSYDADSGRLVLLGDHQVSTTPMRPEYLAAALRAVYSDSAEAPGMTIDPLPNDPHGPLMDVKYFGGTAATKLGWVMFEADRLMKGYSVGLDNVLKTPVQSTVPGYQSMADMGLEQAGTGAKLWNRFWLVPAPIAARVSDDGKTLAFDPVTLFVRTETMRWSNGKLVSAEGERDAHAEAFASHFSAHYAEFAREQPVYAELQTVTQAVALAKFLRAQGVPLNAAFVRHFAGEPYPTPTRTPSAQVVKQRTERDGRTTRVLRLMSFGGVDMSPQLATRPDASAGRLQAAVQRALADADALTGFDVAVDGHTYRAVALPLGGEAVVGSHQEAASDLASARDEPLLATLPGLARYYDSTHNEPSELGYGWTRLLPELRPEAGAEAGKIEHIAVDGVPGTQVRVRPFTLSNAFGLGEERFVEPFVDQELNRIGFRPLRPDSAYRGVYPEGEDTFRLIFRSGEQAVFDADGRLRVVFAADARADYEYDRQHGRLVRLHLSGKGRDTAVRFEYDERGRITALASGAQRVRYGYDASGNLASVATGATTIRYGYEAAPRRLLTSAARDGQAPTHYQYDARGRLIAADGPDGQHLEQRFERTAQGTVVTQRSGASRVRRVFDPHGHELADVEPAAADAAAPAPAADAAEAAGQGWHVEAIAGERAFKVSDPLGRQTEYRFTPADQLASVRAGGQEQVAFVYDSAGRLTAARYPEGSDTFERDAAGRVTRYQRTVDGDVSALVLGYDREGAVNTLSSPALGTLSLRTTPRELSITRGRATVRLQFDEAGRPLALQAPGGLSVRYGYAANGELNALDAERGARQAYLHIEDRTVRVRSFTSAADTRYTLDEQGSVVAVTDPLGAHFAYAYDAQRRLTRVVLPDGRCTEFVYHEAPAFTVEERTAPCAAPPG